MFKRTIVAAVALALLMSSFAFTSGKAFAQGHTSTTIPGVWLSSILIQNVSTPDATVQVDFYDKDGVKKKTYALPTALGGGKSITIVVPFTVSDLAAGQYSAVVSSTQKVIASVQTSSGNGTGAAGPWTAFAYEGVDSTNAAKKLFFPAEFNEYYNFKSEIVLQNTSDTTSTNVSVTFYNPNTGAVIATKSLGSIGKNSARTYVVPELVPASAKGNTAGLFGAVVTSDTTDIAGITNVWATVPTNETASYNAFTSGSKTLYAPNLMNVYYGFGSALSIQNVGTGTATGTITYSNGETESFSLGQNIAKTFLQFKRTDITLPSGNAAVNGGSFSAKVALTDASYNAGARIVGIVGFSRPKELNSNVVKGDYAYYNCPSVAAASVYIPSILSDYYGLFTAVSVQNTSDQTTDITLTYENDATKTWTITGVPKNGVANFLHLRKVALNPYHNSTKNSVSAVATSSNGALLVAVVQHNTEPSLTAYDPAKVPSDFLHVFTATPKQ